RLSDRDWLVLERVAALRFVTGSQLTRLCFTDSDDPKANARSARRALLRLVRLGVLERLPRAIGGVRAGSDGFVYRLGLGGYRLVVLKGWQPQRQRRRSQVPGLLFLRHTLQIAELHTRLVECERSGRIELLALHAEPLCHRINDGLGGQRLVLKPDSYARLGLGPYEDSYFIEIDRGTEGSRALHGQLERYIAYYRTGREQRKRGVFPKVLWLANTSEREHVIAACVARLPAEMRLLFAVAPFDQALVVMLEPV
ncbi:MAG: replication-relaxation family protein, partial [Solirubrobacteraceae bacterium]